MNVNWTIIQLFLIAGLVVVAPAAFVIWMMRRQVRAMRSPEIEAEYARAGFDVEISWKHGAPLVTGVHSGTTFMLALNPGAKATPARTVLSVPGAPGEKFDISREGARDLSGRDFIELKFPDAKAGEAVRALFHLGFDAVELRDEKLSAIRHFKAALLHLPALRTAIEQLAILRAIPGSRTSGMNGAPDKSGQANRQSEAHAR